MSENLFNFIQALGAFCGVLVCFLVLFVILSCFFFLGCFLAKIYIRWFKK